MVDTDTGLSEHLRLIKSYKKPKDYYFLKMVRIYLMNRNRHCPRHGCYRR